jgi:NTE family protein
MARKKIGLALSGGGARGFAHIGVLKVLAENDIPIDLIAGTSAGSIVGGAFAAGMSVSAIISMTAKIGWTNTTKPALTPLGVLSNAPLGRFIESEFPVCRFEDLVIPFAAVACDFENDGEVVFKDTGDLAFAIRASCAVPGVFAPLTDVNGRTLVDGGVVAPMPTNAVKKMGAGIVIAVDLMACGQTFRSRPRTAFGMMSQSAMMLLRVISHLRPDQIGKRDEFIALGEEAALEKLDAIKSLISNK